MGKLKESAIKSVVEDKKLDAIRVTNFMGGVSYTLNPLDTLRIIAASSIFAEPSYYRPSKAKASYLKRLYKIDILSSLYDDSTITKTEDLFIKAINNALDFNFEETLKLAVKLRHEFFMRLNPAVIVVMAALHPNRLEWAKANPGKFAEYVKTCTPRPDDIANQLEFYMWRTGDKTSLPNILKRAWANILPQYNKYQLAKYHSKLMIDIIRIAHIACDSNEALDELVKTGTIKVTDEDTTWERLRSQGKSWNEILNTITIPHMALLRNLRNLADDASVDMNTLNGALKQLKAGVLTGKQFPFRYYTAFNAVKNHSNSQKEILIKDALQECLEISINNFPKLKGKVACLSDNSGSAWGAFNSEFGSVTVADIGNLSSVMTAMSSEYGQVNVFGDKLLTKDISQKDGILTQHAEVTKLGREVGGATENGIWLFFDKITKNKEHFDTIFIYSDQQAGHGGLYGINERQYAHARHANGSRYIDVLKLVQIYRKEVNPKVNIFSVQTAGYDNTVLPENLYRGAILTGWTGKEVAYASEIINLWDEKDKTPN